MVNITSIPGERYPTNMHKTTVLNRKRRTLLKRIIARQKEKRRVSINTEHRISAFNGIPDDITKEVASYLDPKSMISFSLCSKGLRKLMISRNHMIGYIRMLSRTRLYPVTSYCGFKFEPKPPSMIPCLKMTNIALDEGSGKTRIEFNHTLYILQMPHDKFAKQTFKFFLKNELFSGINGEMFYINENALPGVFDQCGVRWYVSFTHMQSPVTAYGLELHVISAKFHAYL
jgi:hypothetical protein